MSYSWQDNVAHHERRAGAWEQAGMPTCAAGSRLKAAKWRRRGRELDMLMFGPFPKTKLEALLATHHQRIAGGIVSDFEAILFNG